MSLDEKLYGLMGKALREKEPGARLKLSRTIDLLVFEMARTGRAEEFYASLKKDAAFRETVYPPLDTNIKDPVAAIEDSNRKGVRTSDYVLLFEAAARSVAISVAVTAGVAMPWLPPERSKTMYYTQRLHTASSKEI